MKSTSTNPGQHGVLSKHTTAIIALSTTAFTLLIAEARGGLLGSPYNEKYDFTKVMPKLEQTRVVANGANAPIPVLIEVTSAPGATVKNQKQGTGSWAYLFLTQYPAAREAVKAVAADALRSRGLDPAAQSSELRVSIVLDKFTVEKPHEQTKGFGPFTSQEKDYNRYAFIDGRVQVIKQGTQLYERQLAVQSNRIFGEKGENLRKVSPLLGMVVGSKEKSDGSCELLVEVLQRFENALLMDENFLAALAGRESKFAATVPGH